MKYLSIGLFAFCLSCSAQAPAGKGASEAKRESERNVKYQQLLGKTTIAQANLNDWVTSESNACAAQGKLEGSPKILMLNQGRLICSAPPVPAPVPAPAKPEVKPEEKK